MRVTIRGSKIYLGGEVTELTPDITVCNDIHVVSSAEPQSDYEDLQ